MDMPGRTTPPPGSIGQYRYGMNGQMKEGDVFEGFMSADFWGYDSRLGRRWERDPKYYSYQSPYATFNNNPIVFSDPKGLEGENQLPVPLFLDLKEKDDKVPLTTDLLRIMGKRQSKLEGVLLNKMIGKAFEQMSIVGVNQLKLSSIGWRPVFPNSKKMKSELRSTLTNGKVRHVIPDGIGSVSVWYIKAPEFPKLINNELKTYNRSSFYEVKAYDGTLHLNSNDYQISAYIDIAKKSPAGQANNPHLRPNVTFITTANTVIGNDIITEANVMGVDIFQIKAAVDKSDGAIYLNDPVKLTQTGGIDASMLMFDFFTGFYFDINFGLIPEAADDPDPEILQENDVKK